MTTSAEMMNPVQAESSQQATASAVSQSTRQSEPSQPSLAPPPTSTPTRRRSKLACDTCHYRKIKCDVEKGHPCRNCEKSSVQCTLVGSAMRPPRNISGSSSAAAAAAVAVAIATAAAAQAQSLPATSARRMFNDPGAETRSSSESKEAWSIASIESCSGLLGVMSESNDPRPTNPLGRRASTSGHTVRAQDDSTNSARTLLGSSSSPTSLRALFLAGANGTSSTPSSATGSRLPSNTLFPGFIEGTLFDEQGTDAHMDLSGGCGMDYFNQPASFSSSTSSASSTPSTSLMSGNFAYPSQTPRSLPSSISHFISPLSSPQFLPQSSSLPPTPIQLPVDAAFESGVGNGNGGGTNMNSGITLNGPQSYRPILSRRASGSFLPAQTSVESESRPYHHDRRISAPWMIQGHQHSRLNEGQLPPQAPTIVQLPMQLPIQVHGQLRSGGSSIGLRGRQPRAHSITSITGTKQGTVTEDALTDPTHSVLMRSNSTPASARIVPKSGSRQRHSALPMRRASYLQQSRHSLNLYASTVKVIQDLSLPQQMYRNPLLPPRHSNSLSELQFQLYLQQLQQSQHRRQAQPGPSQDQALSAISVPPSQRGLQGVGAAWGLRSNEIDNGMSLIDLQETTTGNTHTLLPLSEELVASSQPMRPSSLGGVGIGMDLEKQQQQQQCHYFQSSGNEQDQATMFQTITKNPSNWNSNFSSPSTHPFESPAPLLNPVLESPSNMTPIRSAMRHERYTSIDHMQPSDTEHPLQLTEPLDLSPLSGAQEMSETSLASVLDDHLRLFDEIDQVYGASNMDGLPQISLHGPSSIHHGVSQISPTSQTLSNTALQHQCSPFASYAADSTIGASVLNLQDTTLSGPTHSVMGRALAQAIATGGCPENNQIRQPGLPYFQGEPIRGGSLTGTTRSTTADLSALDLSVFPGVSESFPMSMSLPNTSFMGQASEYRG